MIFSEKLNRHLNPFWKIILIVFFFEEGYFGILAKIFFNKIKHKANFETYASLLTNLHYILEIVAKFR